MRRIYLGSLLLLFCLLCLACSNGPGNNNNNGQPCNGECGEGYECIDNSYCLPICQKGLTRCGTTCVDSSKNKEHCGACGKVCGDKEICVKGACKEPVTCDPGKTNCEDSCVDTKQDGANCGSCGTICDKGETCSNGSCVVECPSGQERCDGACTDLQSSDAHCGACGNRCPTEKTCDSGSCVCAGGTVVCNDKCVDTSGSDEHCGACGNKCQGGKTCDSGNCECPSGQTDCNGSCVDLRTSSKHCGACGKVCSSRQACENSQCIIKTCPKGQSLCNGACLDVNSSNDHCGACNNKCSAGRVCRAGVCSCPTTQEDCSGLCVDLQSSFSHCGVCGNTCAAGESCLGGRCGCAVGQIKCNGVCTSTQSSVKHCGACGNACPATYTCLKGVCKCPAGQTLCQGKCVDTSTSNTHCGGCQKSCSGGSSCNSGACKCPSGKGFCGSACVDKQTDNNNCGKCGLTCSTDKTCIAGACVCKSNQVVCAGACTDIQTSAKHCGGCGQSCSGKEACSAGQCSCPKAYDVCSVGGGGTACVDFFTDTSHCGKCNNKCSSGSSCVLGVCRQQWMAPMDGGPDRSSGRDTEHDAVSVGVDSSGNVYIAGNMMNTNYFGTTSLNYNGKYPYVAKFDKNGAFQWVKTGTMSYTLREVVFDKSGNAYGVGSGGGGAWVTKISNSGKWQWNRVYKGPNGYHDAWGIALDKNQANFYIAGNFDKSITIGSTTLTSTGGGDSFITKLNSSGTPQWSKVINSTGTEFARGLHVDKFDNLYLTGLFSGTLSFLNGQGSLFTFVATGGQKAYIAKFNSLGVFAWCRSVNGGTSRGVAVVTDSNGDPYVTGWFNSNLVVGTNTFTTKGDYDIFLLKYSSGGVLQWGRTMGGKGYDYSTGLASDSLSNVYLTGLYRSTMTANGKQYASLGGTDFFVAMFDSSGTIKWLNTGGTYSNDDSQGIAVDGTDYYIAGHLGPGPYYGKTSRYERGLLLKNLP